MMRLTKHYGLSRFSTLIALLGILLATIASLPVRAEFSFGFNSSSETQFVAVDEAFPFNFSQQGNVVYLDWQIKPGYYLYQHQLSVSSDNAKIGTPDIPAGQPYKDEFFGDVNIYTEPLTVSVPLLEADNSSVLTVRYQGCAKAGFCYPPEIRQVPLTAVMTAKDVTPPGSATTSALSDKTEVSTDIQTSASTVITPATQQDQLASDLAEQWWTPLVFLALGIGLAFTPCVLPMYPILTGIVLGGGQLSHGRTFRLSFTYVQGMALTYTLLGLVVASAGMQFQAALQHPYVLIGLSVMFVLLALSMFGAYTLQLPSSVQTWLSTLSNRQEGGNTGSVFIMGAISGLVCSPCTTAPLSGALIYVAQSGDLLTGAVALYALALGMGIPLILAAMFGNKLLPKAGNWMVHVKVFFGFILLAVPVFLLERILPHNVVPYLWSALGVAAFGWLYHVKNTLSVSWRSSTLAVIAIVGLFISVQPMYQFIAGEATTAAQQQEMKVEFERVTTIDDLNLALAEAKAQGKPVMLDFYADWCVACKEFEKYTFHDPAVAPRLEQFILLQADVTNSSPADIEMLKEMDVLGLPTLDFWDAEGNRNSRARLTGFMEARPFIDHLENHQLVN
ncbi:Cytochrome c-type biogenesis protein DsbD, protein-disulfide reductase [Photobacterium marinum]|uniref:Thiol:disulfide interchange protein DsbD n=1 Tax=Photobacterium marinum TaxID=1056511 RepID=L8JHV4_9GAMM|nr:protein-disulfide reductase DsbD [Photobacterium marinum]ELR67099.1 Cytochrome c-type biogenesis protein DsbD, protein-disulfide reductase [Photobacterium marinum]